MNSTTMEVKEEHAILHGIRLFNCPCNNDNDKDDLFLLNVLTTVPQGRPKTLLEYFDNQCDNYKYRSMKNFSIRWDNHEKLIEEKVLHDQIANLNLFQSDTDLKLVRHIHNYMRSLFRRKTSTTPCTDFVLVWVIDIHRYEFSEEYLGDTDSDCTSTDTYIPCPTAEGADVHNLFIDVNFSQAYVRKLRQDSSSLNLVKVGPSIQIQDLKLEVVSTQDGYRHIVAENGVEGCCCSICWEAFQGELVAQDRIYNWLPEDHSWSLVRLKCGHVFHHRCIFNWLPDHPTCPYCRSSTLTFI